MIRLFKTLIVILSLLIGASSPVLALDFTFGNNYSPLSQAYLGVCQNAKIPGGELPPEYLKNMCRIVQKSELCKDTKKEDARDCSNPQNNELSWDDNLLGCFKGLGDSLLDIWNVVKAGLGFLYKSATSSDYRGKVSEETDAFLDSLGLYFETEFQKAKEGMSGPAKDFRAGMIVAKNLFVDLFNMVAHLTQKVYGEYACLNSAGQFRLSCRIIGDVFIPPVAIIQTLKKGLPAIKRKIKASTDKLKREQKIAKKAAPRAPPKKEWIDNVVDTDSSGVVFYSKSSERTRIKPVESPRSSGSTRIDPRKKQVIKGDTVRMPEVPKKKIGETGYDHDGFFQSPVKEKAVSESQRLDTPLYNIMNKDKTKEELFLKDAKVKNMEAVSEGVNTTYKVTFEDGTAGIFKPHTKEWASNYRTEVLAYQVDRFLGLDLVPTTIERTMYRMKGSLQRFKHRKAGDYNVWEKAPHTDMDKQYFFDFLIDNRDRHGGNFLIGREGKVISIDHGLSFTGKGNHPGHFHSRRKAIQRFLKTERGKIVINRLNKMDKDKFRDDMIHYLGVKDGDRMMERVNFLLDFYHKEVGYLEGW